MNFILAVIKPSKLDEVREALTSLGVEGMTVSEARDLGARKATGKFIAARNTR